VRWNVTTLLDFGASQYTAQASITLRRFSNAPLRRVGRFGFVADDLSKRSPSERRYACSAFVTDDMR
jgi:hypothetical protein